MYSIAQCRVEQELQHEHNIRDFEFVGDDFLVSVGRDFGRVWNASAGTLIKSNKYPYKHSGYINCVPVSPTSFLFIMGYTIRSFDIVSSHLTDIQLNRVTKKTFHDKFIRPSEVCNEKKL